jgi:hypothetical protein
MWFVVNRAAYGDSLRLFFVINICIDKQNNISKLGMKILKIKIDYMIIAFATILCLASCSKDDEGASSNTQEQEQEEEKQSFVKESDLYGVWVVSGNAASLYFISFSEAGKYSYCFNSTMMGAGTYKLDKNKLTLYNGYLNTIDVVNLEKDNSQIKITGDLQKFKASTKQSVNISISKMNKELPISKTGEVFKIWGLHNTYGSTITYIKYESEYLIKYQYCKDNSLKQVISEANWFYVYNDDMTYTQDCSGNGEVVIYKLQDHYSTLKSQIIKQ